MHALLAAFVRNEPPPEQSDAHWLLDFYGSFMSCSGEDTTERALECLAKVHSCDGAAYWVAFMQQLTWMVTAFLAKKQLPVVIMCRA